MSTLYQFTRRLSDLVPRWPANDLAQGTTGWRNCTLLQVPRPYALHKGVQEISKDSYFPYMPKFASALKDEISRVARKIIREETSTLKTASVVFRSQIAALRRRNQALEQQVKRLGKVAGRRVVDPAKDKDSSGFRFSAKGLAKHRQRLELSAKDFGRLVGASALSVYKWEKGGVRPRGKYLPAIAALRSIGKKEAVARLDQLAR